MNHEGDDIINQAVEELAANHRTEIILNRVIFGAAGFLVGVLMTLLVVHSFR